MSARSVRGDVAVALLVLGLSVAVLLRSAQATRRNVALLTSPGVVLSQLQETKRYECLEGLLRSQVPAGADVVDRGAPGLDFQRIAEELTPGYHFVTRPRAAAYEISFSTTGPCFGTGVSVREVFP